MLRDAALRWLFIASAIAAACYSLLLARATYLFDQNTAASVQQAAELVPYNARYLAREAAWNPDRQASLLEHATALNPFDSESWIQLGLLAEFYRDDPRTAERFYLKAADVNHMFLSKWTLMNFYFRRRNESRFFQWARDTLAITPYSPDPVFTQMWSIAPDAGKIEAAIPERPRILLQYAVFLSSTGRSRAIPAAVQRLIRAVGSDDPHAWGRDDLLPGIEDRLLAAGDLSSASSVWAAMSQAGWLRASVPTPAHPLTNPDFDRRSYGHGFDWVVPSIPGITTDPLPDLKEMRITFSGRQPEACELLRQYMPVEPGAEYQLQWKATADGLTAPSGLMWSLRDFHENAAGHVSPDLLDRNPEWRFRAPAANLCLLTLEYARPAGITMASGTVTLHSVSMIRRVLPTKN